MIHNDRSALALHASCIIVDHNLFEITYADGAVLVASMAATYETMIRELLGRRNLGEGALKTEGVDIVNLLVFNPARFSSAQRDPLLEALDKMAQKPIRSIFEELGFELCRERGCRNEEHPYEYVQADELTAEQILAQVRKASPDRYELDRVIFDVLGLTVKERADVYRAVVDLVKSRLLKARSTKRK